jgi:hypothetical protein
VSGSGSRPGHPIPGTSEGQGQWASPGQLPPGLGKIQIRPYFKSHSNIFRLDRIPLYPGGPPGSGAAAELYGTATAPFGGVFSPGGYDSIYGASLDVMYEIFPPQLDENELWVLRCCSAFHTQLTKLFGSCILCYRQIVVWMLSLIDIKG